MIIHLNLISIIAPFAIFDLDLGDSLRVLTMEVFFNGNPGEFGPMFCLLPVGDEVEDVRIFAAEALLRGGLGCKHFGN